MSIPDKVMKLKDGKILYDDLRERVEDVKSDVENKYTKPANGIPAADLAETYLTSETDPTVPAWAKTANKPSYTASEVGATTSTEVASMIAEAIGGVQSFEVLVVEQLPEQDIQTHTIYFVPKTGDTSDSYDEYIYINDAWEKIGNTQVDLSNYALKTDTVLNTTLSMGRKANTTVGASSTALGYYVEASGPESFATGYSTKASGGYSHAEGQSTEATATGTHAEGDYTHATNYAAHAEGYYSTASGQYSHAEGYNTVANKESAHAEGGYTTAGYRAHAEGYQTNAAGEGSHAEGGYSQATQEYSHAEGYRTTASGQYAHSEGNNTTASGIDSHAEGYGTQATVLYAHAEGNNTLAAAPEAHAEGYYTKATNEASHAEGNYTEASGYYSHAEGYQTKASGANSHAEGSYTIAPGTDSHASGRYNKMDLYPDWVSGTEYKVGDCVLYSFIGYKCKTANTDESFTASKWDQLPTNSPIAMAIGNGESENARSNALTIGWNGSLAQGNTAIASGVGSYAAGAGVTASGAYSHAEGVGSTASGGYSHAEGNGGAQATSYGAHAEGMGTRATGSSSHAEGTGAAAISYADHAEGTGTTAQGGSSHAEGSSTHANGNASHAEGQSTTASGMASHAEGNNTEATNVMAHAEGYGTHATGVISHAEGNLTTASGSLSHAEGTLSVASGDISHAEGNNTIANAANSHASGIYNVAMTLYPDWVANTAYEVGNKVSYNKGGYECITANSDATWTVSKWKALPSNSDTAFVIGNGNSTTRSNAMELKWDGDMALQGDMTLFKGTANEFNVSSLKNASDILIVNLDIDAQDVVTSDISVADIEAAFEAGKSVYGCLTMPSRAGVNITVYSPLTAVNMSGMAQVVIGKFDLGEAQIMVVATSIGGNETWQSNMVLSLTAMSNSASQQPTNYSAGNLPIKNLGAPVDNNDAATKKYVDDHAGGTVTDVQINGTSVLTSGVANVPLATDSTVGVVRGRGDRGTTIVNGWVQIKCPDDSEIKTAGSGYKPIVPTKQHQSVFYGLAKAAGDITQSQSSNAVGTYTPEAQAAIQNMLGISQTGLSVVNGQLCITYEEVSA